MNGPDLSRQKEVTCRKDRVVGEGSKIFRVEKGVVEQKVLGRRVRYMGHGCEEFKEKMKGIKRLKIMSENRRILVMRR